MTRARSSAYWSANRYTDAAQPPEPAAPLTDLPTAAAGRFGALREGLTALPAVVESVRFMGASWRWAWEYGVGNRKLCWVHVIGSAVSVTFTLSDAEEDRVRKLGRLPGDLRRAIDEGQRTGPVRWCWIELDERRTVDSFLRFIAHKAAWLTERPAPHRAPQMRGRRRSPDSLDEAD